MEEEKKEQEKESKGGNLGLPFGLCKKFGISLPEKATPRQAWEALEHKSGMSPKDFYETLKKSVMTELPTKPEFEEKKKEEKPKYDENNYPRKAQKWHGEVDIATSDWRFVGLKPQRQSTKYMKMKRVSDDKNRIVVKIADSNMFETRYGYGVILDRNHVVFIRPDFRNKNYYTGDSSEVILDRKYFNVKPATTPFENFFEDEKELDFDNWVKVAEAQQAREDGDVNWYMPFKSISPWYISKKIRREWENS